MRRELACLNTIHLLNFILLKFCTLVLSCDHSVGPFGFILDHFKLCPREDFSYHFVYFFCVKFMKGTVGGGGVISVYKNLYTKFCIFLRAFGHINWHEKAF